MSESQKTTFEQIADVVMSAPLPFEPGNDNPRLNRHGQNLSVLSFGRVLMDVVSAVSSQEDMTTEVQDKLCAEAVDAYRRARGIIMRGTEETLSVGQLIPSEILMMGEETLSRVFARAFSRREIASDWRGQVETAAVLYRLGYERMAAAEVPSSGSAP